jgi:hypothetical protein
MYLRGRQEGGERDTENSLAGPSCVRNLKYSSKVRQNPDTRNKRGGPMLLSELIRELSNLKKKEGDLPICLGDLQTGFELPIRIVIQEEDSEFHRHIRLYGHDREDVGKEIYKN